MDCCLCFHFRQSPCKLTPLGARMSQLGDRSLVHERGQHGRVCAQGKATAKDIAKGTAAETQNSSQNSVQSMTSPWSEGKGPLVTPKQRINFSVKQIEGQSSSHSAKVCLQFQTWLVTYSEGFLTGVGARSEHSDFIPKLLSEQQQHVNLLCFNDSWGKWMKLEKCSSWVKRPRPRKTNVVCMHS